MLSTTLKKYMDKKGKKPPPGTLDADAKADSKNEYPAPAQKKAASTISKYFRGR